MKSFVIAVVIFISIIALIAVNAVYINKTVNEVILRIESMNYIGEENASAICRYWESSLKIIKYTVNRNEAEKLTAELRTLAGYCAAGFKTEAEISAARAKVYAEALKQEGI